MGHRELVRGVGSLLAGMVLTASCTAGGAVTNEDRSVPSPADLPSPSLTEGRPRSFTTTTVTFVDPTRPTEPIGTVSTPSRDRRLVTDLRVPVGAGPAPLIMFSHGLGGSPAKFTELLNQWAEAGYVVAAPRFPLTSDTNPDHRTDAGDIVNQPGDISFIIDELLAQSATEGNPLTGRINPEQIGAAGMSLGGGTTYGLLYNDCCIDERIDAAIVMGGAVLVFSGANDYERELPLLVLHGDADTALPYELGRDAWSVAAGPAWLITLVGGSHSPPFEDAVTPWDSLVEDTTTAFWDAHLGGDPLALGRVETSVTDAGPLASLERR